MGGAAGAIGQIAGAAIGVSGSQQAAQAQAASAQRGQDLTWAMFQQQQQQQAPWRLAGEAALAELSSIYGLPSYRTTPSGTASVGSRMGETGFEQMEGEFGLDQLLPGIGGNNPFSLISDISDPNISYSPIDYQTYDIQETTGGGAGSGFEKFTSLPGYQFELAEANKAAERALASSGLTGSGAALRSLQEIAQGQAAQGFSDYTAGLAGIAGLGGGFVGRGQMGAAGQMADLYRQQGQAAAQGAINTSNVLGQGISGISQWFGQQSAMQPPSYGGFNAPQYQPPAYNAYGSSLYPNQVGFA